MTDLPPSRYGVYRSTEFSTATARALLGNGRLVRYARGILLDRTRMSDLSTRAAAALLLAGPTAVLAEDTAARLYGCSAADEGTVHVLTGYHRQLHNRPGVAFHQGSIDDQDVAEIDGLPLLVPDLLVARLLCARNRHRALAIADQLLAQLPPNQLSEFKAAVAHRIATRSDPRGRRRAELLLELAGGVAESPQESSLLLTLVDADLPIPERQVAVCDLTGQERYRLDLAWRAPKIAVEYDGYEAHADRTELDAARDADLSRRGWLVIHADAADLRDPARLVHTIREAFGRRKFVA